MFMKDDVYGIGLIPLLICMPIFLYSRYIFLRLLNIEMDKKYHETLQLILFLSFEKMYSVLMNFNQLCKKNSFLPPLARIICDPIVSLFVVAILINSEPYLKIVSFTLYVIPVVISNYHCYVCDETVSSFEGVRNFCLILILHAFAFYLMVIIVEVHDNGNYLDIKPEDANDHDLASQ